MQNQKIQLRKVFRFTQNGKYAKKDIAKDINGTKRQNHVIMIALCK